MNNTYFGPFQVNLPNVSGLLYGATGGQATIHLVNVTPSPLTVTMSVVPSETPPYGQTPIVAVPPLLLEGAQNTTNLTYAYTSVNGSPTSWTLPAYGQPGSNIAVVLGVNRFAMAGTNGALYAGMLRFTDSLGFSQVNIPVSATVADNTGLWVGTANISGVSYDLKTYATNADGSYVSTLVTNQVVTYTTNSAATLGLATNLLIANSITTNVQTAYYTITNQEIDTYTSNSDSVITSGFVVSTNLLVELDFATNLDITTSVTGYYFTNNGALLVWQTTNSTNIIVTASPPLTNQLVVTNQIAAVPSNGAPVLVTNLEYDNYSVQYLLTTNAIFSPPVTNLQSSTTYILTNFTVTTNAAYNAMATNVTATISMTTNPPFVTNYSTTATLVSASATTNSFLVPYLSVFTNPPNLIAVSVTTNAYATTNSLFVTLTTNSYLINQSYVVVNNSTNPAGSSTNLVYGFTSNAPVVSALQDYTNLALVFTTNPLVIPATNVLVSSISNYVIASYNTNLDSVVAPYPLRLIVFNDANGTCSLLQRVYYGLRQDTNLVVATTESVLDVSHLNAARRITATHLPWAATNVPWAFSGGPLALGGVYSTKIIEPYDDQAANPFLHTYHPDHNNLDTESPPHELAVGSESYEIDRVITLSIIANTNDFISLTAANSAMSGIYYETIALQGLSGYAKNYQTVGNFSLKRISPISTLTTH